MLADHRVQPGDPGDPLGQPGLAQPATGLVLQFDVVVILGPVVSHQQQQLPVLPTAQTVYSVVCQQPAGELPAT
jgi:hypothetical protein